MDERRTLALFGWTIGGVVGLMFVLNAFSLSSLQPAASAHARHLVSQASQPGATPARLAYEAQSTAARP